MNSSRRVLALTSLISLGLALGTGCAADSDPAASEEAIGSASSELGTLERGPKPPIERKPGVTTLHGLLGGLSVGRLQSSGLGGGARYFVRTADGAMRPVELRATVIAKAGGMKKIIGKQITLTGSATSASGALVATSVVPDLNFDEDTSSAPVTQLGAKRNVTVLCKFAELPDPDPHTPDYFRSLMGATAPGVGDYWSKASRGQLTIDGSTVTEWAEMPQTFAQYAAMSKGDRIGAYLSDCIGTGFASVDYDQFDSITMAFSHNIEEQIFGGQLRLQFAGAMRWFGIGVLSPVEFNNQSSVNRTLGLGLGVTLSGSAPERLDSPWDVMSQGYGTTNGYSCRGLTTSFGCASVFPLAEDALRAGWTTSAQVATVPTAATFTVNLDFVGTTPLAGHSSVVHIPIDATHHYTLEARNQAAGTYDFGVPSTALVLHTMDTTVYDAPNEAQAQDAAMRLRLVTALPVGTTSYQDNVGKFSLDFTPQSFGYAVTVTRGYPLTVNATGGSAQIYGADVSCLAGTTAGSACHVAIPFNTTVQLTAAPTDPSQEVKSWGGCASVIDNRCTVTMDQAKSVTVRLGAAPRACVCLPSWPVYKCQQICGDDF